ncbi:hypothetical protein N7495_004259 [Penicillium taxi]|uniref:uncharacterized protein n=1 Tax=Penicillium taxi TaxID=168475 RepID=UPI0025457A76|nr:uncharacterized protein N7495_004259 [Penicillium taxi]KAJ5899515.1 hypothetical protein N7495_004259 [Penicillium taxi]
MRSSVKPSAYPFLPLQIIRFLSLLSAVVVGIILAVFISHLHTDGYKLPFAFLIVRPTVTHNTSKLDTNAKITKQLLITAALSIVNVIFTALVGCCCGLPTKLSLALNIPLLILWAISLALLSYGMSSTILASCTKEYWGNSTGISVCHSYKALFAFTAVGTASYMAALALDVIVRGRQNRLGVYDPMNSQAAFAPGEDPMDFKLADRRSESVSAVHYDASPASGGHHATFSNGAEYSHAGEARGYYDDAQASRGYGRVDAYEQDEYHHASRQTGYDAGSYR